MASDGSTYHHGNLKRVLLDTALKMIQERGDFHFTMRELARRAEVTHNAPYRHFADKNTLLAALAEEGFTVLGKALVRRRKKEGSDPVRHLRTLAQEVVKFAIKKPFHYQLMFGNVLRGNADKHPPLKKASEEVFLILAGVLQACQDEGSARTDFTASELAVGAWSMAHGLSSLALSGHLAKKQNAAIRLSDQLADMLFEGIIKHREATLTSP